MVFLTLKSYEGKILLRESIVKVNYLKLFHLNFDTEMTIKNLKCNKERKIHYKENNEKVSMFSFSIFSRNSNLFVLIYRFS